VRISEKIVSQADAAIPARADEARSGISARGIILGLVLVIAISFIVSYAELVTARILIGSQQLPPAVIAVFALIIVANAGLRKASRRLGLSATELAMIYCMMLLSALISARGIVEKLLPMLVTSNYFANANNKWTELYAPHTKSWLVPFDVNGTANQLVSNRYFEGLRVGEHIPWNLWVTPLAVWGVLCLLILFAFLCLASIIRAQWTDNEKLSFPLAQPALELVRETQGGTLFANKFLWLGFAIPVCIYGLNGLNAWFPNLPLIPVSYSTGQYFANPPWNAMGGIRAYLSFAGIGLAFLLSSEVIFSLWFFYLLAQLQGVTANGLGWPMDGMPMYPCWLIIGYQVAGAYVALSAYMAYSGRAHLRKVGRCFWQREEVDDSHELIPYRVAVWGLAICFTLALVWCRLAGMSVWLAVLELGTLIFVVAVVLARSTAEAGLFMTETSFRPVDLYRMFAPVQHLGPGNLTTMAFLDGAFMRDQRGLVLTGILDGLRVSDGAAVKRRGLLPGFIAAGVLALVFAAVVQIWLSYTRGSVHLYGYIMQGNNLWAFTNYQQYMTQSASNSIDWRCPTFFAVGIGVTVFLSYMRSMFFWWPFHPLGYALMGSWTMVVMWFSCLVAWLIKAPVLRYGGMKLYLRARPFFIGLMLGEFAMAVFWTLISATTGAPTPEFPWP
jgi:hypothetical protein